MACKLIGLVRVSTDDQGVSGLGLEAQQAAIAAYSLATGCSVVKTYVEVESGRIDDIDGRPELVKAIRHAKRANATLVFARIDRLIRSTLVAAYIKKSGVRLAVCDMPSVDEFTFDIHVAVAAEQGRKIALTTKLALAAAKARGVKLGNPQNLNDQARAKGRALGVQAVQKKADRFAEDLGPVARELREQGQTYQAIADHLNGLEYKTPRGKAWSPMQVKRVIER